MNQSAGLKAKIMAAAYMSEASPNTLPVVDGGVFFNRKYRRMAARNKARKMMKRVRGQA